MSEVQRAAIKAHIPKVYIDGNRVTIVGLSRASHRLCEGADGGTSERLRAVHRGFGRYDRWSRHGRRQAIFAALFGSIIYQLKDRGFVIDDQKLQLDT